MKQKAIITLHRPELTEEERERRMAKIRQATVDFLVAVERNRAKRRKL